MSRADVAVLGAGPAGMAAATEAGRLGLSVSLIDEQPQAGGQIYRAVARASDRQAGILGADYTSGAKLVAALARAPVTHVAGATVWQVDGGGTVAFSVEGIGRQVSARRVVLALGALERPMPIPGWTLPGVMTAGAAQILLKQSGVAPSNAVLAGSGPLLYLVAQQLLRAGCPPKALVETQSTANMLGAMRHLSGALMGWRYLVKGAGMLADIRKAGIRRYTGARSLEIQGNGSAEAILFKTGRTPHRIESGTFLLHQGVVPNIQATRSLGLEHSWNPLQRAFVPVTDEWGRTSNEIFYVAGDGGGIGGARAAEHAGRIAAMDIATNLGAIGRAERDRESRGERLALARELAIRPFLDEAFSPAKDTLRPDDETIVCRCEEVTAGDIRRYAKLGCAGPNQTKAFGRCGMGPCQGRYCGLTVTEILAEANETSPQETGYYRIRAPLKPVTIGEVAALDAEAGLEHVAQAK